MSEAQRRGKKRQFSEEAKANMKGKCGVYIRTEETRKKISQRNKGKYASIETRKKISIANIGRKHSQETNISSFLF